MSIFLNILFLIIGMVLLIKGADFFVSGASNLAKKFKIPAFLIGLTIVAIGTSLPELSVSIASAIKGGTDLSVGNIVGSNMMNMLLILGLVAVIKPIKIDKNTKRINVSFLLGVSAMLLLFAADIILNREDVNKISRSEGMVMLVVLVVYLSILVNNAKKQRRAKYEGADGEKYLEKENEEAKKEKILKPWQIILCIVFGLAAVVFGAECVCSTAQFLALKMGMSEALVGLTIVAIGTSLPELATSIAASAKGDNEMALGNVIGSNVMNIALILGVVATIGNVAVSATILVDILILAVCTLVLSIICLCRKQNINRIIGVILILMYFAYMTFAIVRNYCF